MLIAIRMDYSKSIYERKKKKSPKDFFFQRVEKVKVLNFYTLVTVEK